MIISWRIYCCCCCCWLYDALYEGTYIIQTLTKYIIYRTAIHSTCSLCGAIIPSIQHDEDCIFFRRWLHQSVWHKKIDFFCSPVWAKSISLAGEISFSCPPPNSSSDDIIALTIDAIRNNYNRYKYWFFVVFGDFFVAHWCVLRRQIGTLSMNKTPKFVWMQLALESRFCRLYI